MELTRHLEAAHGGRETLVNTALLTTRAMLRLPKITQKQYDAYTTMPYLKSNRSLGD